MDITSANAVYTLTVATLFTSPQTLQQFAVDDIYSTEPQTIAETVMGADGKLSAGYTPVPITQHINLMADSPSMDLFEQWNANSRLNRTVYAAQGIIILPSINKKWAMVNGILQIFPPIPNAAKILQSRRFTIVWESAPQAPV